MRRTAVLGLALLAAGCSSSATNAPAGSDNRAVVGEVGGLLGAYTGEFRKGPQKLADVARYENGYPLGFEAVKSGEVVVVWGARVTVEEGGGVDPNATGVAAYEKKVPADGGFVLLQNGTVKEMTAAEFAAAPKATK